MLRIERICERHGTQAAIARRTGIGAPAVSRIVRGLEPPYPKRGRAIADAVGWPGDWRELFEEEDEPGDGDGEEFGAASGGGDGDGEGFEAAGGGCDGEGDSMCGE